MIEFSIKAWLGFSLLVILASGAGLAFACFISWKDTARQARMNLAFGLALGPFLAGLAIILALYFFPRDSHATHLWVTALILFIPCALGLTKWSSRPQQIIDPRSPSLGFYLLCALLILWISALLVNSVFIPLIANDALEYATVGRELFHVRTLDAYPVLNPDTNLSGFYGPWTHPPLYVSLIYLMSIIQRHADAPGLMRLIAPWFLITATFGVVSLGILRSKTFGLLSGVLFLSTPLLFLGAGAGAIDALAVSGVTLIILILLGARNDTAKYSISLGLVLGVSLWTHSQALLFVPLIFAMLIIRRGFSDWLMIVKEAVIVSICALVVGGAPYFKNWTIYGSAVSDNPPVFALRELDWSGYFSYARGLDNWAAIIQYGVLKGWFVPTSFGFAFWLWTLGAFLFWRQFRRNEKVGKTGLRQSLLDQEQQLLWLSGSFVVVYLLGVLCSVGLGVDIMIRNGRYMLVMVPALVFLAAYAVELSCQRATNLLSRTTTPGLLRDAILGLAIGCSAIILLNYFLVGLYAEWRQVPSQPKPDIFAEDAAEGNQSKAPRFDFILDYWPSIRLARQLDDVVPADSLVLSMRPADMYYTKRRFVSYLDPRLIGVYREKTARAVAQKLQELGIHFIQLTDYSLPPFYNSALQSVLADPELSRLESSVGMSQLYSLHSSGLKKSTATELAPPGFPWARSHLFPAFVPKSIVELIGFQPTPFKSSESVTTSLLNHQDQSVLLATGFAGGIGWGALKQTFIGIENAEYLINLGLHGKGFVRLWIAQFDSTGAPVLYDTIDKGKPLRIGEIALTESHPGQDFARRFRPHPDGKFLRIGVEHFGRSSVLIEKASITKLEPVN